MFRRGIIRAGNSLKWDLQMIARSQHRIARTGTLTDEMILGRLLTRQARPSNTSVRMAEHSVASRMLGLSAIDRD